jgi:hypothetical protein
MASSLRETSKKWMQVKHGEKKKQLSNAGFGFYNVYIRIEIVRLY